MQADIFPSGNRSGPADRFTDIAFDAQYQFMGTIEAEPMQEHMQMGGEHKAKAGKHTITAHATWIHENQDWKASFPLGNTSRQSSFLNTFKINANYYYKSHFGMLGGTVAYFSTTGPRDTLLYAPDPVDGSRTGSPNSSGFILELNYLRYEITKFLTLKSSLQYTIYTKFNGAHSNYDGSGRNASDNNMLYALVWLMF